MKIENDNKEVDRYRFETGSLYEFDISQNAYICVWTNGYDNTKKKAIKSYEDYLYRGRESWKQF